MERTPATLRQMLGRSLAAFQHLAAPAPESPSLDMDWAVFCRHLSGVVQLRQDNDPVETAIALEKSMQAKKDAGEETGRDSETVALLYLLGAALNPDPRAFNNLAVLSAEADDMVNALHWLRLGLSLFPEDTTLQENLELLQ